VTAAQQVDTSTTRTLRIGTANIGLIGLDMAINEAAAKNMSAENAVDFIFARIKEKNYIPAKAEDQYRESLASVYHRHMQADGWQPEGLIIRIFGTGCVGYSRTGNKNLKLPAVHTIIVKRFSVLYLLLGAGVNTDLGRLRPAINFPAVTGNKVGSLPCNFPFFRCAGEELCRPPKQTGRPRPIDDFKEPVVLTA